MAACQAPGEPDKSNKPTLPRHHQVVDSGQVAGDGLSEDVARPDTALPALDGGLFSTDADSGRAETDTPTPGDVGVTAKPDIDLQAMTVLKTVPADGAESTPLKVSFSVHFSAPLLAASIASYTVSVLGPGGQPIDGELEVNGNLFTFTAKAAIKPASPVVVKLSQLVQSDQGETLAEPFVFRFYTRGYLDMEPYRALAERYAPVLLQAIGSNSAVFDLLRSPDYDGDWDGSNNVAHVAQHPALAQVGWTVIESQSHFFIHYVFFWPKRVAATADLSCDNDSAGSTVVVARYPTEAPVALLTWFKRQFDEQMWAWATKESGLLPAGKKASGANLRQVLPLETLFPSAQSAQDSLGCGGIGGCKPRRYLGLLTAASHQSCLWLDKGDKAYNQCRTDAAALKNMKLVRYVPAAKASAAKSNGAPVGKEPPTYGYQLVPLFETLYPHREEHGPGHLFASPISFTYQPPPGRPGGKTTPMATQYFSKVTGDFGRPPWAWRWKPATLSSWYDMPLGTPFLDPAWALLMRMGGSDGGIIAFDSKAKTGLSTDYCFNPLLYIDSRSTNACKTSLPIAKP
jgi:hypothetical protein